MDLSNERKLAVLTDKNVFEAFGKVPDKADVKKWKKELKVHAAKTFSDTKNSTKAYIESLQNAQTEADAVAEAERAKIDAKAKSIGASSRTETRFYTQEQLAEQAQQRQEEKARKIEEEAEAKLREHQEELDSMQRARDSVSDSFRERRSSVLEQIPDQPGTFKAKTYETFKYRLAKFDSLAKGARTFLTSEDEEDRLQRLKQMIEDARIKDEKLDLNGKLDRPSVLLMEAFRDNQLNPPFGERNKLQESEKEQVLRQVQTVMTRLGNAILQTNLLALPKHVVESMSQFEFSFNDEEEEVAMSDAEFNDAAKKAYVCLKSYVNGKINESRHTVKDVQKTITMLRIKANHALDAVAGLEVQTVALGVRQLMVLLRLQVPLIAFPNDPLTPRKYYFIMGDDYLPGRERPTSRNETEDEELLRKQVKEPKFTWGKYVGLLRNPISDTAPGLNEEAQLNNLHTYYSKFFVFRNNREKNARQNRYDQLRDVFNFFGNVQYRATRQANFVAHQMLSDPILWRLVQKHSSTRIFFDPSQYTGNFELRSIYKNDFEPSKVVETLDKIYKDTRNIEKLVDKSPQHNETVKQTFNFMSTQASAERVERQSSMQNFIRKQEVAQ